MSPSSAEFASSTIPNYVNWPTSKSSLWLHITFMVAAWMIFHPLVMVIQLSPGAAAWMLSLLLLLFNSIGLVSGLFYHSYTPNLYEGQVHGTIGWVLMCIVFMKLMWDLRVTCLNRRKNLQSAAKGLDLRPSADGQYIPLEAYRDEQTSLQLEGDEDDQDRESVFNNSCQSEPFLQSHPAVSRPRVLSGLRKRIMKPFRTSSTRLAKSMRGCSSQSFFPSAHFLHRTHDTMILVLSLTGFMSGTVVYLGALRGSYLISGIFNLVQGSQLICYGVFNVFRWAGAFIETGWSWNRHSGGRVKSSRYFRPSVECCESVLIIFNTVVRMVIRSFLPGSEDTNSLERRYIAIDAVCFGAGLCGLLMESKALHQLFTSKPNEPGEGKDDSIQFGMAWSPNPFPALCIMLSAYFLSMHGSGSEPTRTLQSRTGGLLMGFAVCRLTTYILLHISPPQSNLPSRPISEIIGAFCVITAGVVTMACTRGVTDSMGPEALVEFFVLTTAATISLFVMGWSVMLYVFGRQGCLDK